MPPLPVITDVYRCALNWSDGTGRNAVNVIHLLASTAETPNDVFNGLQDAVTHDMWNSVHDSFFVTSVSVTPLDGVTATQEFATDLGAEWQGGGTGDTIPSTAPIVKLVTGFRGRSGRGRVFLPYTAESAVADGFLAPEYLANMQSAWTAFIPAILSFSKELVVASYLLAETNTVLSAVVETAVGTQRRRQDRLRV